ncbi:MAG: hypothetical protein NTY38_31070, partial [Acidobacteria bacterium]|nr:hypothetical protein [Acidobacteriota bacterium]
LEEFGVDWKDAGVLRRNAIYAAWLAEVERLEALGSLVWMIGVAKDDQQPYGLDNFVLQSPGDCPEFRSAGR